MNFNTKIVEKLHYRLSLGIPKEVEIEAYSKNYWFTPQDIRFALSGIEYMTKPARVEVWLSSYHYQDISSQRVGIIMAGNLPFVGIADLIAAVVCRCKIYVKYSSKDTVLMAWVVGVLKELGADIYNLEPLTSIDSMIATGANNSNRYFNDIYPQSRKLLRGSRTSVAIVERMCSDNDLQLLWKDCFQYYGLGCRNVSHIFIERGFEIERIVDLWATKNILHEDYLGSYRQQKALLSMTGQPFRDGGYYILQQSDSLFAHIGVITYSLFDDSEKVESAIEVLSGQLQCVVSTSHIGFGKAQMPAFEDYADGVDTLKFLLNEYIACR